MQKQQILFRSTNTYKNNDTDESPGCSDRETTKSYTKKKIEIHKSFLSFLLNTMVVQIYKYEHAEMKA